MKSDRRRARSLPHVLLVNPWIHDFSAYDFWAKPLGLLGLAAILRSHDYRVSYIDCLDRFHPRDPRRDRIDSTDLPVRCGRGPYRKTPLPTPASIPDVPRTFSRYGIRPEWFRESLEALPKPDLILITSMMTYWYPGIQETIGHIRGVFPETPIVLGGIYASICTEHAVSVSGADRVIGGQAEGAILDVAAEYTGFSASLRFDPELPDTHPYPALDLQSRIPYIPLLTSRGCPFSCVYCASRFLNPKRTRRTPESVVEEIRFWHRSYEAVDFVLYDDAFLAEAEAHAVPILEGILNSGMRLRFHTPNALHIRGITPEIAGLMFGAGFSTLRLGLETAAAREDGMDRKATVEEFRSAASCLRNAGFRKDQVGAYLLAGLPGQSPQTILESIEVVHRSGITPVPAYYSPIPKTALWKEALQSSRYDLASDPIFTNKAIMPCQREPFSWEMISRLKKAARAESG
ncbi:MAG: radical SAM protein [Desulfobacteraceae bacterium]|nr:MAG: radical SAM protein [Desulfobacteraceae bacterium]